jgi:hypothetical protein
MVVPFIKVEDFKDGNIHAFKIMNAGWVPEGTVFRRLEILEAPRIVANCFLKNEIPI